MFTGCDGLNIKNKMLDLKMDAERESMIMAHIRTLSSIACAIQLM